MRPHAPAIRPLARLALFGPILAAGLTVPAQALTPPLSVPAPQNVDHLVEPLSINGGSIPDPRGPGTDSTATPMTTTASGPYTPRQIQSIYGITPTDLANATGRTVAVIDANIPHDVESVLATYRNSFGLAPCSRANGCLTVIDEHGNPIDPAATSIPASDGWRFEVMLDVEAVSAACPTCDIVLVDANSAQINDLDAGVASALGIGAQYVSMSYGVGEWDTESGEDQTFASHKATFVAASGDSGFTGGSALYPATSPNVVAAGGASVTAVDGQWQATTWSGSGSGCSAYEYANSVQASNSALWSACYGKVPVADVSALADPNGGLEVYNPTSQGTWFSGGGTSLAAPLIASLYAIAGNNTAPFAPYGTVRSNPALLSDLIRGATVNCPAATNILCAAATGWDGPTGLGTPRAPAALSASGIGSVPPSMGDQNNTPPDPGLSPGFPPSISFKGRPRIEGVVRRRHRVTARYSLDIVSAQGERSAAVVPVHVAWLLSGRLISTGTSVKVRPGWVGKSLSFQIIAGTGVESISTRSPSVKVGR